MYILHLLSTFQPWLDRYFQAFRLKEFLRNFQRFQTSIIHIKRVITQYSNISNLNSSYQKRFHSIFNDFRPPSQHIEVNRRRRHINILLGCITAVFFICWGPLIFYTILFEFRPDILPEQTVMASVGYTLSLLFGLLTPIANPVFYGLLNDPFKEVMRAKFPWLFCVRSNSAIGNLTVQSLAFTLPAIQKRNRFKISVDQNQRTFSVEKSPEESDESLKEGKSIGVSLRENESQSVAVALNGRHNEVFMKSKIMEIIEETTV